MIDPDTSQKLSPNNSFLRWLRLFWWTPAAVISILAMIITMAARITLSDYQNWILLLLSILAAIGWFTTRKKLKDQ